MARSYMLDFVVTLALSWEDCLSTACCYTMMKTLTDYFPAALLAVKLSWTAVTTFFQFAQLFSIPGGISKQCFFKIS
jgi:hypothetical protein